MSDRHRLLERQLVKARQAHDGALDIAALLGLVDEAYGEQERDRRRIDRANGLMTEELDSLTEELRASASAAALQSLRFQAALDNMSQGLCLYDRDGRVVVCNRRFLAIYDIEPTATVVGTRIEKMLEGSRALAGSSQLERRYLIADHVGLSTDVRTTLEQQWSDGRTISIVRDPVVDGGYVDTVADVTETKQASLKIAHMARHDPLTDLPNRTLFRERLVEGLRDARNDRLCAVLLLDLDRFKTVNDTLGHPVGDALLIAVAERLNSRVVAPGSVARLGGDEFAVVIPSLPQPSYAEDLARAIIQDLSRSYILNGKQVLIGASIGIDVATSASRDPDELLRNADLALYKAKTDGRGRHRVFATELHLALSERRQLEVDLRRAIADDELEVHYQPQVDTRVDGVTGFEALARWHHAVRGFVPPMEFIPLAEDVGLIDEIGAWVLDRACRDARQWPDHITVSVNVSAAQFKSGRLLNLVRDVLLKHGVRPGRLELEITESVFLQEDTQATTTLHDLKKLGVRIALDDFGTGYSSMSFVRKFPFDRIKIDRSFVQDLGQSTEALAIVRAVAVLCQGLGITSTVEGVENAKQARVLAEEGYHHVQGYLFGRPMPLHDTHGFLSPVRMRCQTMSRRQLLRI